MIKSVLILVSSIIGAAFASGKEIEIFFKNQNSILPLLISSILFILIPAKIYTELINNKITDYKSYVYYKFKKNGKYVLFISIILAIAIYTAMISGAENVIKGGSLFLSFLSVVIFFLDAKGIESLSFFSTPLLVAGIILNCNITLQTSAFYKFKSYTYSLYNILSAFPVMCSFGKYLKNKKQAILSSFISGAILSLLMILIYLVLPDKTSPMPLLDLALNNGIGVFYKVILFLAIFTTAVSSGFGFIHSVNISRHRSIILLFITGMLFTYFGFEQLVAVITTAFGVIGTIILIYIVLSS